MPHLEVPSSRTYQPDIIVRNPQNRDDQGHVEARSDGRSPREVLESPGVVVLAQRVKQGPRHVVAPVSVSTGNRQAEATVSDGDSRIIDPGSHVQVPELPTRPLGRLKVNARLQTPVSECTQKGGLASGIRIHGIAKSSGRKSAGTGSHQNQGIVHTIRGYVVVVDARHHGAVEARIVVPSQEFVVAVGKPVIHRDQFH